MPSLAARQGVGGAGQHGGTGCGSVAAGSSAGLSSPKVSFALDSALEESGFEPSVPPATGKLFNCAGSLRATPFIVAHRPLSLSPCRGQPRLVRLITSPARPYLLK